MSLETTRIRKGRLSDFLSKCNLIPVNNINNHNIIHNSSNSLNASKPLVNISNHFEIKENNTNNNKSTTHNQIYNYNQNKSLFEDSTLNFNHVQLSQAQLQKDGKYKSTREFIHGERFIILQDENREITHTSL